MKKIEDILFYTATRVQPPKEGLGKIIQELPVTNFNRPRYSYVMGSRFALPIGIVVLVLLVFFSAKNSNPKPQTVLELPATITKQNVSDSMKKVDIGITAGMDDMDNDLNELDQESENEKLDSESSIETDETDENLNQENVDKSNTTNVKGAEDERE